MSYDEDHAVTLGGKRRIAHQVPKATTTLLNELAFKRDSLSKIRMGANGIKQSQPSSSSFQAQKAKKKRIILSSDEESEEDTDSKKARVQRPYGFNGRSQEVDGTRTRTLSDSSDEGEKWLSAREFQPQKPKLPPPPSIKFVAKRSRIMSTSTEDEEPNNRSLRAVVRQARLGAKRRKEMQGSESEDEEPELPDDAFSDKDDDAAEIAAMERQFSGSESSDSEQENQNRSSADMKVVYAKCLNLFNTTTREELLQLPKSTPKLVDFICEFRPFASFSQLESKLSAVSRGRGLLDGQIEHFENRGVLEKVLDDCEGSSKQIESELKRMMKQTLQSQPKSLDPNCTLHSYQQIGLNWMMMMDRLGMSGILADEMGLGKTIQVIAFLTHLKETGAPGPHLIIVPSSTIENWMGEMTKWSPTLKVETYYGSQAERAEISSRVKHIKKEADVLLTTYNMICSKPEDRRFFKKFSINYIIYDEGHMLKSCNTSRYQTLMKINGKRKLLLTGTPLQNNLCELISLMYFTLPKLFTRYCDDISQLLQQFQRKQNGKGMTASSAELYEKSTIEQAKAILAPFVLRRLKANVLSSLPKKLEYVESVELTDEQRDMYRTRVLDLRFQKESGDYSMAGGLMQLRQLANHPLLTRKLYDEDKLARIAKILCSREREYQKKKPEHVAEDMTFMSDFAIHKLCQKFDTISQFALDPEESLQSGKCRELDRLLPSIKQKGEKVLIFSQFTSLLDILEVYLSVRGHAFCRLDGATPVMERQELINEFNTNPDLFVFLLSTRAGGMGINLTAANHIIIHDIDFNPYNDKQAEDRCHRMGQKSDVHVHRFISKGTIEEGMHAAAKQKLELERDVTGQSNGSDKVDPQLVVALLTEALALADE